MVAQHRALVASCFILFCMFSRLQALGMATVHTKARQAEYLGGIKRFPVPDDKVPWEVEWPDYRPVDYTAPSVLKGPVWADPDIRTSPADPPLKFNQMDGKVNRVSHTGPYQIVDGVPRNPAGRTGMIGRGLLGKWGPNHAADPVCTRWKRDNEGKQVLKDGKPLLEFVAIKRKDTGDWALPGGMVEAGDTVSATLKKEFGEEALNSLELPEDEKRKAERQINELFKHGTELYAGYVDDPRNTDNAWMETVAVNFHDETGEGFNKVTLQAGDDAGDIAWTIASKTVQLYASHKSFIEKAAQLHDAAW